MQWLDIISSWLPWDLSFVSCKKVADSIRCPYQGMKNEWGRNKRINSSFWSRAKSRRKSSSRRFYRDRTHCYLPLTMSSHLSKHHIYGNHLFPFFSVFHSIMPKVASQLGETKKFKVSSSIFLLVDSRFLFFPINVVCKTDRRKT